MEERCPDMLLSLALSGFLLIGVLDSSNADVGKKVFCYYSSFAQNRQGVGKFLPEDINPFLCTHVIFAFVDVNQDGTDLIPFNRNDVGPAGLYERTLSLKNVNPALKVLLAVGGWQIGSKPFLAVVHHPHTMMTWISNVIVFLRKFNFDGLDMDWEFPATRGSLPEDKYRYTTLMKGLYEAFAAESRKTGREKLLLTMATASGTYYINTSYEPRKIIPYMDYMLLMTYNYHGQWEKRTGHHSPLRKHRNDPPGEQSELNQNWSIDFWLDMGVPKDKLVVGLATYGMTFTLQDPRQHTVHSPAVGGGRMGRYTKETGILAYYEICRNIQNAGWQRVWIEDQLVPYVYGDDQWAGYDDVVSIKLKADNIMERDLAGAFVWSVEMDDFHGVCGDRKYPLLTAITRILQPYKNSVVVAPGTRQMEKISKSEPWNEARDSATSTSVSGHGERDGNGLVSADTLWTERMASTEFGDLSKEKIGQVKKRRRQRKRRKPIWRPSKVSRTTFLPWWFRTMRLPQQPISHDSRVTPRPSLNTFSPGRAHSSPVFSVGERENVGSENRLEYGDHWLKKGKKRKPKVKRRRTVRRHDRGRQMSAAAVASATKGSVSCHGLRAGLHLHPEDCGKFIMCMPGAWLSLPPHVMACPHSMRFDDRIKVCNHARDVDC